SSTRRTRGAARAAKLSRRRASTRPIRRGAKPREPEPKIGPKIGTASAIAQASAAYPVHPNGACPRATHLRERPVTSDEHARISRITLADYDSRAASFWEGTKDHDVTQNYEALLSRIEAPPPFAVLDFGCGPGRDLR